MSVSDKVSLERPAAVESKLVAAERASVHSTADRSESVAVPSEFTVRLGGGGLGSAPYTPLATPLTSLQDLDSATRPAEYEVVDSKGVTHAIDKGEMQRIYHKTLEQDELEELHLDDGRPHYAPTMKYRPYIVKQMLSIPLDEEADAIESGSSLSSKVNETRKDADRVAASAAVAASSSSSAVTTTTTALPSSSAAASAVASTSGDPTSIAESSTLTHHRSGDAQITEVSPAPSSGGSGTGSREIPESPQPRSIDTGSTIITSVGGSPVTATATDEIAIGTQTSKSKKTTEDSYSVSAPTTAALTKSSSQRRVSRRLSDIVMADPHWSKQYTFLSTFDKWRHISLQIMRNHNCFDVLPLSSKVVVFDTLLPVKHALRALAEHDTKSAPVWDSRRHCFVGLLTVTDFTLILSKCVDNRRGSATDEEESVSFDGTAGRGAHLLFPMGSTLDSTGTLKARSKRGSVLSLDESGIRRAVRQMEELNVGQWLKLKRRSDRYTSRRRARLLAARVSESTMSVDDSRSSMSVGSDPKLASPTATSASGVTGAASSISLASSSSAMKSGKKARNNVIGVLYDEPLISAVCTINREHIHRLPVFKDEERKSLLSILNYSQILRFLILRLEEDHRTSITVTLDQLDFPCLDTPAMRQARMTGCVADLSSLSELIKEVKQSRVFGVGPASVPIIFLDDPLLTVVSLLAENWRWQACVILDPSDFTVKGAFLRSDIRFFSMNRAYLNLGQSVGRFLEEHRNERRVVKVRCSKQLFHAMYNMLAMRQHCCVVVSDTNELIAVLSLRDIFERLVYV